LTWGETFGPPKGGNELEKRRHQKMPRWVRTCEGRSLDDNYKDAELGRQAGLGIKGGRNNTNTG